MGYLEGNDLPPEQRHALMSLILGSLEELAQGKGVPNRLWARVQRLLDADARLYAGLVGYWAAVDDADGFAISPKIRALAWDSLPAHGQ